ncbi:MAG: hypothetical protein E6861_24325, partial [Stenotrophomonas maltophilia]|nr:hypothetical protein [Stenotrophomonas maltophilia]
MQIATGMQGHWGVFIGELLHSAFSHHILLEVAGGHLMMVAEDLACADQRRIVLQAGQALPRLQQPPAKVAFAGAPIEPMGGVLGKLQGGAKRLDLLPFAPR